MSTRRGRARTAPATAQAWIELRSDDPEAVSAAAVVRAHLPGGEALRSLRRARVLELTGELPDRAGIEELLHRSIQFYNPHKERCTVRAAAADPAPMSADEFAVLVVDRGGDRRGAAEHWWQHQAGTAIEVREGVAWLVTFEPGATAGRDARALAAELAVVRDRRHGLLCNPNAQDVDVAAGTPPLPWIPRAGNAAAAGAGEGAER